MQAAVGQRRESSGMGRVTPFIFSLSVMDESGDCQLSDLSKYGRDVERLRFWPSIFLPRFVHPRPMT